MSFQRYCHARSHDLANNISHLAVNFNNDQEIEIEIEIFFILLHRKNVYLIKDVHVDQDNI